MILLTMKYITKGVNLSVHGFKVMKYRNWIFIIILFLSLVFLSWFDVTSSNQAGLRNADRSMAHLFIAMSVITHAAYLIFYKSSTLSSRTISRTLIFIFLWFCFVDFIRYASITTVGPMLLLSIWWYLTYNFTYSYLRSNQGNLTPLLIVYIGMFFVWILLNLYARSQIITNFDRENAVTGYAYYLLIFIPYIFLLEKKWIKTLLTLILSIMVITSFKRGTIITLPMMLLVYGYVKEVRSGHMIRFIGNFILVSIFSIVMLFIIDEKSDGFLLDRFSKEELAEGSGRSEYRKIALDVIAERNLIDLFIGTGHGSSVKLIGTGIHNEWVEFLFSFGLVGLILYIILGFKFLKQGYYYYKQKSKYAPHMLMMVTYFYMVSLFSGFIGVYVTYYFFAFMGIITYLNEQNINMLRVR